MDLQIGDRSFAARMLTVGPMKAMRHDVNAVIRMVAKAQKLGPKVKTGGLSLDEALDVMSPEETQSAQRVIYASLVDPGMAEAEFVAWTDQLPWNTGPADLMTAVLRVMLGDPDAARTEDPSPGEAVSPESSISSGSTGSSSPQPDGPSST